MTETLGTAGAHKMLHAISEIQREITGLKKDAVNDYFKSQYVTLNSLLAVVMPELEKRNMMLLQPVQRIHEQGWRVRSMIVNKDSGDAIWSDFPLPEAILMKPQAVGSAITYGRRYSLVSLLSLQSLDDDGEGSMGRSTPGRAEQQRSRTEQLIKDLK